MADTRTGTGHREDQMQQFRSQIKGFPMTKEKKIRAKINKIVLDLKSKV